MAWDFQAPAIFMPMPFFYMPPCAFISIWLSLTFPHNGVVCLVINSVIVFVDHVISFEEKKKIYSLLPVVFHILTAME